MQIQSYPASRLPGLANKSLLVSSYSAHLLQASNLDSVQFGQTQTNKFTIVTKANRYKLDTTDTPSYDKLSTEIHRFIEDYSGKNFDSDFAHRLFDLIAVSKKYVDHHVKDKALNFKITHDSLNNKLGYWPTALSWFEEMKGYQNEPLSKISKEIGTDLSSSYPNIHDIGTLKTYVFVKLLRLLGNLQVQDNRPINDLPNFINQITEGDQLLANSRNIELSLSGEGAFSKGLPKKITKKHLGCIYTHLVQNALKYGLPEGGYVNVSFTKDKESLLLTVENTSRAQIPQKDIENGELFKEGHRCSATAENVQGTGYGLFQVKEMVDDLNGTIEVTSENNHGSIVTTFTVKLPLEEVATKQHRQQEHNVFRLVPA